MSRFLDAITILGVLVLFMLASSDLLACELEPHPYVGFNVGKTVNFFDYQDPPNADEIAASWEVGFRFPVSKQFSWEVDWHHQSWITTLADSDDARDTLSIGIEYKLIAD